MKLHSSLYGFFFLTQRIAHLLDMVILLVNQKHYFETRTFKVMCDILKQENDCS